MKNTFQIKHIRHATEILSVSGKKLLIDPMLSPKGVNPPIPLTKNRVNNPIVELPVSLNELDNIDGVLLTHIHTDHFDKAAKEYLSKNMPMFCQPSDVKKLQSAGFKQIVPIQQEYTWDNLHIIRVKANHGTSFITALMGNVSGYMLDAEGHKIYIAGDAVFDKTAERNIANYNPEIVIVNAGGARMLFGSPITMTGQDIANLCMLFPSIKVVAVHMEAINHCALSRKDLRTYLDKQNLSHNVIIPYDGEVIDF